MAVLVRPAEPRDTRWMLKGLKDLDARFGCRRRLYKHGLDVRTRLGEFLDRHCCLVAENGEGPVGFVGGFLHRHPLAPGLICLTETFWWVDERQNRAAVALLDEFVRWGRGKGADWITFELMGTDSPGGGALRRRGFREVQRIFLLEP